MLGVLFLLVMVGASCFFAGFFLGQNGKKAEERARQEVENQLIAAGLGEVSIVNGKRTFTVKKH